MGHAFISYSHLDLAYVERLVAELASRGLNVWTDRGVDPGVQWIEAIEREIEACAAFVPVMSVHSTTAPWVRREILRAQDLGKPILPLRLSGSRSMQLLDIQDEDVQGGHLPSAAWIARLERLLAKGPPEPAQPPSNDRGGSVPPTARLLRTFAGHTRCVRSVAWSPDGRMLASGGEDSAALVWDSVTGNLRRRLGRHTDWVCAVAWSPDGRFVATAGGERRVVVWTDANLPEVTLTGHHGNVLALAWSPNGQQIASASADGTVLVHHTGGGHRREISGHTGRVFSVAWSRGGRLATGSLAMGSLATGSADKTARRWDPVRGDEVGRPYPHAGTVRSVAWSPDGRYLATASHNAAVRVWDTSVGGVVTPTEHGGPAWAVAWSPNGRLLACGGEDATIRLWDTSTGTEFHTLSGHTGAVRTLAWSTSDSRLLASGGQDGTVRIWMLPAP